MPTIDLPHLPRFLFGLVVILISLYVLDQYQPKLTRLYMAVLVLGAVLVYRDELADFLLWIRQSTGSATED